jgi:hypothetical protein
VAHRINTKGRLNQNIHTVFSSFPQISASVLSGNRLILTIFFPSLSMIFLQGVNNTLLLAGENYKGRDCQIGTNWKKKSSRRRNTFPGGELFTLG